MADPSVDTTATGLVDQEARDRIRQDLASTLFVEAGAGSGKTSALVDRVMALVTEGGVELGQIAAITFTDKAATELRDRIRRKLVEGTDPTASTPAALRCRTALDQLDGAAIGTLHAFAERILAEHPVEAGLPPRLEVVDGVRASAAFERRWSAFFDALLGDSAMERPLVLLFAAGVRPDCLRALAQVFDDNWDLVDERVPVTAPDPPQVRARLAEVLAKAAELREEGCADPDDRLCKRVNEIADHLDRVAAIEDEADLLEALSSKAVSFKVGRLGRTASWEDVDAVRVRVRELGGLVTAVRTEVAEACVHRVAAALRHFTLEGARDRQASGQLQFHDLLVLARSLVCDPDHGPLVRARLHQRYRRILLDEFQDTDPIQIELAVRIAAAEPASKAAGSLPWEEVRVAPGHLFVVGDPKQSIYRFRRADISTYLAASGCLGDGGSVELSANFRTVAPVIEWINATFGRLMGAPEAESPGATPPRYVALRPVRHEAPVGPPVSVLGRVAHPATSHAADLRLAEAAGVAAAICRAVDERWSVDDGKGGWRPARLGDVAVLVPTRTSLPDLEDALDEAHVPYRSESSSVPYAHRAVRDLLMVARAVDDPTDQLALVSALRTPLFGCGDDDLFRFRRQRGGRWTYLAEQPGTVPADDPVRRGLAGLRSLFDRRHWLTVSQLLDRIAVDRRAYELGFAGGRPRDVWRRLRYVVDQARAWDEATGGTLREYLAWVALQAADRSSAAEAVLPEPDDDAVRIMTIHSAKGLEFPITIVSGLSSPPTSSSASAEAVFSPTTGVGYRLGSLRTPAFDLQRQIEEQLDHYERLRLLYVACTRARDHLVVSLHRCDRPAATGPLRRTPAELLLEGSGERVGEMVDAEPPSAGPVTLALGVSRPPRPPAPFDEWQREREAVLDRAGRPWTVTATGLAGGTLAAPDGGDPDPGLRKQGRDLDLPPWLKGRYGTAVGRAVHGVLQTVDLTSGAGLDAAVASQCEAEAVVERTDDVRRLVTAALDAPVVRQAAAGPYWREVYVCAPVGDRLLEGYLDLLARTPAGLVVIDYKTASTTDDDELDRLAMGYRRQGAAYALAAAETTGEPVARVTFLFLTPLGAVERDLPDLAAAVEEVRRAVGAGSPVRSS